MAEFIKVATTSDLAPGEKMLVEYEDEDVGLFNIDGKFYAISDVCTHDDQTMPAVSPVPRYKVKIDDGDVLIAPEQD
jgi:nitrite reductase/ring-hydroxylating ferredoxin subunit